MAVSHGKSSIWSKPCIRKLAEAHSTRRLYGRKQTRALGRERQEAFDRLLPLLQIPSPFLWDSLFPKKKPVWLEIGFGNGEHLAGLMRRHPECNFIGAEPFINGMAAFLKEIENDPRDNIRVWMDDALLLAGQIPDACLEGIYVLNPDPWPKTRHRKRRIINRENLDQLTRILKPGGQLIMATDVDGLAEWMVTQAVLHPALEWRAEKSDDWRRMPDDWIKTRYEQKGAAKGRRQSYLLFQKSL